MQRQAQIPLLQKLAQSRRRRIIRQRSCPNSLFGAPHLNIHCFHLLVISIISVNVGSVLQSSRHLRSVCLGCTAAKAWNIISYRLPGITAHNKRHLFLGNIIIGAKKSATITVYHALLRGPDNRLTVPLAGWYVGKFRVAANRRLPGQPINHRRQHGSGQAFFRRKFRCGVSIH